MAICFCHVKRLDVCLAFSTRYLRDSIYNEVFTHVCMYKRVRVYVVFMHVFACECEC